VTLTKEDIQSLSNDAVLCMYRTIAIAKTDADTAVLLMRIGATLNMLALKAATDYADLRDEAIEKQIKLTEWAEEVLAKAKA